MITVIILKTNFTNIIVIILNNKVLTTSLYGGEVQLMSLSLTDTRFLITVMVMMVMMMIVNVIIER